jgi:hypothetical protein
MEENNLCFTCQKPLTEKFIIEGENVCKNCKEILTNSKIFVFCGICGAGRVFVKRTEKAINTLCIINAHSRIGKFDRNVFNTLITLVRNTGMVLFPLRFCPECTPPIKKIKKEELTISSVISGS